eukprot:TRINITY_DN2841_c1_g1_i4.p1 TRINITY_DN2841_c1_g1~~TRINITY_DN2841_c1_g1_i4.p1  ORF type:complete len:395 (+),score=49.25 TRINITY_DN2841_c1_g1_i4:70-1185(+)
MTVRRGATNPLVCHGHSRPIVEVNYSTVTPDGYFLVSASKDGQPMLRNGETGDWIGTFQGHKGAVWSCVLNFPALLAATGSADFSARVWDALSGEEQHAFQHSHIVRSVEFAEHTDHLLTGSMDKKLYIFDVEKPENDPVNLPSQSDGIRWARWCHDDTIVACCFIKNPGVAFMDVRSKQMVYALQTSKAVTSMEVAGNQALTTDGDLVRLWDLRNFRQYKQYQFSYEVEAASISPNGALMVAGGSDMWVHLYDVKSGQEIDCQKGPKLNKKLSLSQHIFESQSYFQVCIIIYMGSYHKEEFKVRLLPEEGSGSGESVTVEVSVNNGVRVLQGEGGRSLKSFPLKTISNWSKTKRCNDKKNGKIAGKTKKK